MLIPVFLSCLQIKKGEGKKQKYPNCCHLTIKKPRSFNGCGVFLVFARVFWLTCLRITCDICKLSSVKTRLLQMKLQMKFGFKKAVDGICHCYGFIIHGVLIYVF